MLTDLIKAQWEIRTSDETQIRDNALFRDTRITEKDWARINESKLRFREEWLNILVRGFDVKGAECEGETTNLDAIGTCWLTKKGAVKIVKMTGNSPDRGCLVVLNNGEIPEVDNYTKLLHELDDLHSVRFSFPDTTLGEILESEASKHMLASELVEIARNTLCVDGNMLYLKLLDSFEEALERSVKEYV